MGKARILALFILLFPLAILRAGDKSLGNLGQYRSCYNVLHYDIHVNVHPSSRMIEGYNIITAEIVSAAKLIQIEYVKEMHIGNITTDNGTQIHFARKGRAVLINLPREMNKGEIFKFKVQFSGQPLVAKKAPWDGGFVWNKDKESNDWVGLACESKGASIWLPSKDHWSDEPDSVDMHLGVPRGLTGVSNGSLMGNSSLSDSFVVFHWKTVNPINHYDISINVGKYAHISDSYPGVLGPLKKDFYVLSYNAAKAIVHFRESDTMLNAFEYYFGAYPFYKDGYKLVETPYWGMEHQSCVAYGNNYRYNKYGFDFILVHESGHEWFANSITASDPADMWIHESFTTYSEALYLEFTKGKEVSQDYLNMQRNNIVSKFPMQGKRNIDFHDWHDNDIYYKGTWILHTLRNHVGNDSIWQDYLKSLSAEFRHKITNTEEIVAFTKQKLNLGNNRILEYYLNNPEIPELVMTLSKDQMSGKPVISYCLKGVPKGVSLTIRLNNNKFIMFANAIVLKKQLENLNEIDFQEISNHYLVKITRVGF